MRKPKTRIGRPKLGENRVTLRARLARSAYQVLQEELTQRRVLGHRVQVGDRFRAIDAGDLLAEAIDLTFKRRIYSTRASASMSLLQVPREQIQNMHLLAELKDAASLHWIAHKRGHRDAIEVVFVGDRFGIAWGDSGAPTWIVARDVESALDAWERGV